MRIATDYMGDIEYNEKEMISFPEGLFGFENHRNFIIVGELNQEFPFVWLQSTEDSSVVFILTDPFLFTDNYDFKLSDENLAKLKASKTEDINIYSTVVIPMESRKTTINLKSPIIINSNKRIGIQAILEEDYPYKHTIFNKE